MKVSFFGPTYNGRSNSLDPSRCINFYPELNPNTNAKSPISLIGTPGTINSIDTDQNLIRGLYAFNGIQYIVAGYKFFSYDGTTLIERGVLSTSTNPVIIKDNGRIGHQLCIVDGSNVYIYDPTSLEFTQLSSNMIPFRPMHLAYLDGYFIVIDDDLTHYSSELYNGLIFPGLAQAKVLATTDRLKGVVNVQQQLAFIKQGSTEFWYNAGVPTSLGSPFARVQGAVLDFGTDASYSIVRGPSASTFFLGYHKLNGETQFAGVIHLTGYTPQIISPPAINYRINNMSKINDAIGYVYSEDGHTFYVLTFPTADATLVYDLTTQMWHERYTYRESDAPDVIGRHVGNCYTYYNGKHYIGDYQSGKVYEMSSSYYTDDGNPIISTRRAMISYDGIDLEDQSIYRFYVDAEVGRSDPDVIEEPKAMLSWSNDGGSTWSNRYEASLGRIGQYNTRLIWRRLGLARNRVFDLTISDPIRKILVDVYADIY